MGQSPPGFGGSDVTLTISAETDKLWVELPPVLPKQRFYVASDTEAFARVTPLLNFTTDENGRPVAIELQPGLVAVRKTD